MADINLLYDEFKQLLKDPGSLALGIECNSAGDAVTLFIDGRIDILETHSASITPFFVFDALFGEIDASLRKEIVLSFRQLVRTTIAANPSPPTDVLSTTIPRAFNAGLLLLAGQPERLPFARLGRTILESQTWPLVTRESAAFYLSSVGRPEDNPAFWKSLLSGDERNFATLIPTVFSVLVQKDPNSALPTIADASRRGVSCDVFASNAVRFFGEAICKRLGDAEMQRIADGYSHNLGSQLRTALNELGQLRAWPSVGQESRLPTIHGRGLGATVTADDISWLGVPETPDGVTLLATMLVRRGARNTAQQVLQYMLKNLDAAATASVRAAQVKDAARGWNAALVEHEAANGKSDEPVEHNVIEMNRSAQLILVGEYAIGERRECERQLGGRQPSKVLMEHLQDRWRREGRGKYIDAFAVELREHLRKLKDWRGALILGSSEFHQDRIMMPLIQEVLQSQDIWTEIEDIPWVPKDRIYNQTIDVRLGAKVATKHTNDGVFEFHGFKAFARTQYITELFRNSTSGPKDLYDACSSVLAALQDNNVFAVPVKARAKVASSLAAFEYIGDAFDLVANAIDALCSASERRTRLADTNDQRFEAFVLGKSGLYCGGAINSLMLEKWWANRQWWPQDSPQEVFEILSPQEISEGIRLATLKRSRKMKPDSVVRIENYLCFGDRLQGKPARQARQALVYLHRAVGMQLGKWAKDVCEANEKKLANGLGRSTAASMHILTDTTNMSDKRGHYSYVSDPVDAARLINSSDTFYTDF